MADLHNEAELPDSFIAARDVRESDAGAAVLARLPLALRKLYCLDRVRGHLLPRPAVMTVILSKSTTKGDISVASLLQCS